MLMIRMRQWTPLKRKFNFFFFSLWTLLLTTLFGLCQAFVACIIQSNNELLTRLFFCITSSPNFLKYLDGRSQDRSFSKTQYLSVDFNLRLHKKCDLHHIGQHGWTLITSVSHWKCKMQGHSPGCQKAAAYILQVRWGLAVALVCVCMLDLDHTQYLAVNQRSHGYCCAICLLWGSVGIPR